MAKRGPRTSNRWFRVGSEDPDRLVIACWVVIVYLPAYRDGMRWSRNRVRCSSGGVVATEGVTPIRGGREGSGGRDEQWLGGESGLGGLGVRGQGRIQRAEGEAQARKRLGELCSC